MTNRTKKKANILDCYIDLVDMKEAVQSIEQIIEKGVPSQVVTLNAEIVYKARQEPELRQIINSSHLVTPDGIGIVWAAKRMGYSITERVTGIDLVYELCNRAAEKGRKLYLLGAKPGIAEAAGKKLIQEYPGLIISGVHDGYFTDVQLEDIIKEIKISAPDILLVGLGAPRQEYWINENKEKLGVPVCMGVGGSFDVIAGIKERAPEIFIKLNIEWLYRLITEPSRFKRQLALPRFALLVLKNKYIKTNKV